MSVDAYATLRTQIGRKLGDPHGDVFDADTVDELLNEAQRDFAEQTKCLLNETVLSARENIETYNFPPDYLSFIRMEDEDGAEIGAVDWQWLLDQYGEDFRATTGDPLYVYSDLDRKGQFRFYPRPATSKIETAVTGDEQFMQPVNYPVDAGLFSRIASNGKDLAIVDNTNVHVFTQEFSNLSLRKTIAHGITVASGPTDIIIVGREYGGFISDDTVIWAVGKNIYFTTITGGATTLFGTHANNITKFYGAIGSDSGVTTGQYLLFADSTGIWSTDISSFSANQEVAIASPGQGACYGTPRNYIAIACGSNGIYTAEYDESTGLAVTQTSTTTTASLVATGSAEDTSDLYCIRTVTSRSIVQLSSGDVVHASVDNGGLWWDGEHLCVGATSGSSSRVVTLYDLAGDEVLEYTCPTTSPYTIYAMTCTYGTMAGCYGVMYYIDAGPAIWSTDTDRGAVVYVDGVTFDSEEGAVVDATDDDVPIVFETEEGAVTQWFSNTAAFRLWYHRYPQADMLEVTDERALVHYALWKAYDEDSELRNEVKSNLHRVEYERRVAEWLGDRFRGYLKGIRKRPRIYQF